MATERERARCRERLERLGEAGLDCDSLRYEAISDLQRVIGFDRWCWPLADPETLLAGSGLALHDFGPAVPRSLELEYSTDGFAAKHVLARRANPAASLSGETAGDLARSGRWDQVMRPVGIGDVAAVACRDALGCWGWVEAYRDVGDHSFTEDDIDLLASVGAQLGSALRRRVMHDGNGRVGDPNPQGVLILDGASRPIGWTRAAHDWIATLPSARLFALFGILPTVVYPAATRARAGEPGAHGLQRAVDGRWVMIEAAPLEGFDDGRVAVTFRSATLSETFELLCRVYALTPRQRQLVWLVVAGLDTRAIAEQLFISRYTVQDHLKSVFAKAGIHSRRELLTTLGAHGV
jgi:DNA-binding CsgD family transcriptional regulator